MIPIVTPREMAQVDAVATVPVQILIERAGTAVAWAARRYLGGVYGHRIVVVAGPGNNGADGRVAARRLRGWGARVVEVEPGAGAIASAVSLVIDAAYGTGLSRPYSAPHTDAPVLAVDISSGVNGMTGELLGAPMRADLTVTFQALKPGLLFYPGAMFAGEITVIDLGLDVSQARAHLLEEVDVAALLPQRRADEHKWRSACWVVAGSAGMTGAADLAAGAAARSGAGYVRLSVPGGQAQGPIEAVGYPLPDEGWADQLGDIDRFGALVMGPGLGRSPSTLAQVARAAGLDVPMVLDGDALRAFDGSFEALTARTTPVVLTPHDGEFRALTGASPGPDRIAAARALAADAAAIVLLKGPATVVAAPDGRVLVTATGDERLATAGTGDVLSGIIGALLAQGVGPFHSAAIGSWLHGRAGALAPRRAMVASDLLSLLPEVFDASYLG